jgi:hypothetical protein
MRPKSATIAQVKFVKLHLPMTQWYSGHYYLDLVNRI